MIRKFLAVEIKSATLAYFLSVVALAFAMAILVAVSTYIGGGGSASGLSMATKIMYILMLGFFIFFITGAFATVTSLLPAYLFIWLARKFAIRQVIIYLLAGAAIALPFCAPLVSMMSMTWYTDPPGMANGLGFGQYQILAPLCGLSGAFAGLVFWFLCGRWLGPLNKCQHRLKTDLPK